MSHRFDASPRFEWRVATRIEKLSGATYGAGFVRWECDCGSIGQWQTAACRASARRTQLLQTSAGSTQERAADDDKRLSLVIAHHGDKKMHQSNNKQGDKQ